MKNTLSTVMLLCLMTLNMSVAKVQASNTIPILVGFGPGSSNDLVARQLSKDLSQDLNINIIVENKPGTGGVIAAKDISKRQGPAFFLHHNGLYISAFVTKQLHLSEFKKIKPVAYIGAIPMVLVTNPENSIRTISDLNKLSSPTILAGSTGLGGLSYASVEYLKNFVNKPITQVQYKSTNSASLDLAAGHLDIAVDFINTALPHIQAKKISPLAVISDRPIETLPGVPTMLDLGIKWNLKSFYMLYATADVDDALIDQVRNSIVKIMTQNPNHYIRQGIILDITKIQDSKKIHQQTATSYVK
jgi:tripartite-type tricarboxylate transporter receptor subunit TctC